MVSFEDDIKILGYDIVDQAESVGMDEFYRLWIWHKEDKFALFGDHGNGWWGFRRFLTDEEVEIYDLTTQSREVAKKRTN